LAFAGYLTSQLIRHMRRGCVTVKSSAAGIVP
jgi:hypothetical protein